MDVLYTLNDKFVPQVAAWICSVCENNGRWEIDFHIISSWIVKENQEELKKLAEKYNNTLCVYELESLETYFDFKFDTNWWNPIVLARLLVDKILPKEINKLLYLDWDTIVRWSLRELWHTDMWKKTIWMSIEPTEDEVRKNNLWLHNYPYCNAWVLLINMERFREIEAWNIIIDYYREHDWQLFANDQDAINASMKDEIYILQPKYNFYNIFWQYPYRFMVKLMDNVSYFSKEEYMDSVNNPIIIHYLWEERPRRAWNYHKYRDDYKKYLWMTIRKDTPDEKWWKLYFFCRYVFNFFMKPFPLFRYRIINYLIPKFMEFRKNQLAKINLGRNKLSI